jgi:hypothetical protein
MNPNFGAAVRRRRWSSLLITTLVVVALPYGFGHRGAHAVRSLLVPGAGLYNHRHGFIGATFTVAAIVATVCWIRWGMDWLVAAIVVASMGAAATLAHTDHPAVALVEMSAAHEFPLVVLVMGALSSAQLAWRRSAFGRRHVARNRIAGRTPLPGIDQCRAASILRLAGTDEAVGLNISALTNRCRRVGVGARFRVSGDPMRTDHAHVRTALLLTGHLDESATRKMLDDADHAFAGVPSSEPGWTRLLDGTLAALALRRSGDEQVGERWSAALNGPFARRGQRRPGSLWTPLGLRGPSADTWEQSAATAVAYATGWLSNADDWAALRKRTLAAAARGNGVADDERLVAAGRIWLTSTHDEEASRILERVTIRRDPLAVALDALAASLRTNPTMLRADPETTRTTTTTTTKQTTR